MKIKIIRRITSLFLLSILLCSTDCDREKRFVVKSYAIKNLTSNEVDIRFYQTDFNFNGEVLPYVKTFEFNLGENEKSEPIDYEDVESSTLERDIFIHLTFKSSDSVVVVFNNNKKLTYEFTYQQNFKSNDRNIFNDLNYVENEEGTFVYEIGEEDYNEAINCNGNCE